MVAPRRGSSLWLWVGAAVAVVALALVVAMRLVNHTQLGLLMLAERGFTCDGSTTSSYGSPSQSDATVAMSVDATSWHVLRNGRVWGQGTYSIDGDSVTISIESFGGKPATLRVGGLGNLQLSGSQPVSVNASGWQVAFDPAGQKVTITSGSGDSITCRVN